MIPIEVTTPTRPFDSLDDSNGADPAVLAFIRKFYANSCIKEEYKEVIRNTFMNGYCLYFAHMLQYAFGKGEVCWCAPYGHIVWCAEYNGKTYAYDVEGVSDCGEVDYYIPERYLGDLLMGFKHTNDEWDDEDDAILIADAISRYKWDLEHKEGQCDV